MFVPWAADASSWWEVTVYSPEVLVLGRGKFLVLQSTRWRMEGGAGYEAVLGWKESLSLVGMQLCQSAVTEGRNLLQLQRRKWMGSRTFLQTGKNEHDCVTCNNSLVVGREGVLPS